jgi:hypothetical protein
MELLQKILDNKDNLKEDRWFYPESLLEEFEIYDHISTDGRLTKKWFESWTCTDTTVGIAVYFLDGELICVSWKPYRKSDEEFWFISEELGKKLYDYFLSLIGEDKKSLRLIETLPNLEEISSKIDYKKFEFSAKKE